MKYVYKFKKVSIPFISIQNHVVFDPIQLKFQLLPIFFF